jgi:amino acid adenylation domain-containing protein
VAGREYPELEDQIGNYVNTLVLRTRFQGTDTFRQLAAHVKETLLGAYQFQDYPFDVLVKALNQQSNSRSNDLFEVLVELQTQDTGSAGALFRFDGLMMRPLEGLATETSQFDLSFTFTELPDQISLLITYNPDVFSSENAERLCTHFERLLTLALQQPDEQIDCLDYITPEERHQLLRDFNTANAVLYADQPAVEDDRQTCSYAQLEDAANAIAARLEGDYSVGRGDLVAILMDRSVCMVASILAVWKCGAAYVPIDPTYPGPRIRSIMAGAAPKILMGNSPLVSRHREFIEAVPVSLIDELPRESGTGSHPSSRARPGDLAYVIFTSGSTGKPKGVMVEHTGMLNHLLAKVNDLHLSPASVVCQNASSSFDISIWQFFSALLSGGKTVIFSDRQAIDPAAWRAAIARAGVNILEVVPSYLSLLLDLAPTTLSLQYMLVTGETLPHALVRRWFASYPRIPLVNAYGPTEAADDITHCFMTESPAMGPIPIGRPVQNMNIYILNGHLQLAPVGVTGEICVSGPGVGRGYLNDAVKTGQSFLDNPFDPGTRLYRTGDAGRWLPDGNIEYLGRRDHQVKVRGNRIELGEIEAALSGFAGVRQAVVVVTKDAGGENQLVAYCAADATVVQAALRNHLQALLPSYMVPVFFVLLPQLPLTLNGKVDRAALPEPNTLVTEASAYQAPSNALERQLLKVWEDVLGRKGIGVNDSIFELGGHSLSVIRIINAVQTLFSVKVELGELFQKPTIAHLAREIHFRQVLSEMEARNGSGEHTEMVI